MNTEFLLLLQGARRVGQQQGLGHSHHAEQAADAAAAGRRAGDLNLIKGRLLIDEMNMNNNL